MTPFPVYMHGTHLTYGNPLSGNNITSWYFFIVPAKSVDMLTELSEDCCCNLSVAIPNRLTLETSVLEFTNNIRESLKL